MWSAETDISDKIIAEEDIMMSFSYTINDPMGIHARPAGLLVKAAKAYKSKITVKKGEKEVDATRLIALMGLGVKCGDEVTFSIDGEDEAEACEAMKAFMADNL